MQKSPPGCSSLDDMTIMTLETVIYEPILEHCSHRPSVPSVPEVSARCCGNHSPVRDQNPCAKDYVSRGRPGGLRRTQRIRCESLDKAWGGFCTYLL